MKKIGIDAIDFYIPSVGLKIHDLAVARNIEPAKLEKGLGLKAMALMDVNEDAASMACLLYTSPSPRDTRRSRMPSSA